MTFCRFAAVLLPFLVLTGCQTPVYQEQGWASCIADSYAGRMTSSGQVYYPNYFTAAHNTLPFGTELTVKNLYTGRSVKAVVTDRFPYYPGRVVNLSSAAAQSIGMPHMQLAQVKVVAYKVPQTNYAPQQQQAYQQPYAAPQQSYQAPPQQPYYPQQQTYTQPQQSYPSYPGQPATQQPYYPQAQPQQTPTWGGTPGYPAQSQPRMTAPVTQAPVQQQPRPSFFQRLRGGTPSAPAYQGGASTPPGLKTF